MNPGAVVTALLVTGTVAACGGPAARVEVVPGSRAGSLAFRIEAAGARDVRVEAVTVAGAGGTRRGRSPGPTYWFLARRPDARGLALPAVVRYGAAPPGYAATRAVVLLPPGSYQVDVLSGGRHAVTRFDVETSGAVE